jgi:4-carboxymuconolactone decarboxylase
MSQLPYPRRDDLDEVGQATWDSVVTTRGERVIDADGHFTGPFNALLHAPSGLHISELGASLRWHSSLESRLLETAVLTVAAHWKAEYEWWSHARLALDAGVSAEVIEAIAAETDVVFALDDERVAHVTARQLAQAGRLDEATWAAAHELLGDRGIAELVFLCGYYTLVSFGLNAFDVPLPAGEAYRWKR